MCHGPSTDRCAAHPPTTACEEGALDCKMCGLPFHTYQHVLQTALGLALPTCWTGRWLGVLEGTVSEVGGGAGGGRVFHVGGCRAVCFEFGRTDSADPFVIGSQQFGICIQTTEGSTIQKTLKIMKIVYFMFEAAACLF